jgi:hypothetical protein
MDMTLAQRQDGWHLLDDAGNADLGPFRTLDAAREFMDWNDERLRHLAAAKPQE